MSVGIGYYARLGAAKETAYGTAVACTDRIPFTSETFGEDWKLDQKEVLTGKPGWRTAERKAKAVGGGFESWLCYDQKISSQFVGTDLILVTALGAATWDNVNGVNQFTMTDELSRFITLAMIKHYDIGTPNDSIVWEIVSAFIKSLEISGTAGEPVKLSADLIAYDMLRSGVTNTAAGLLGLPSTAPARCHFGDAVFRIGAISAALQSSNKVQIKSFNLKLDNKLSDPLFSTPNASGIPVGNLTAQPVRAGIREVTLEIAFARYEDQTLFSNFSSLSAVQADLTFTSGSTYVKLFFPHLVVESIEAPISGAELTEKKVLLRALRGADYSTSGNTYMKFSDGSTTIVEEFAIETKDGRTAAP